jgi:hypothetical protein
MSIASAVGLEGAERYPEKPAARMGVGGGGGPGIDQRTASRRWQASVCLMETGDWPDEDAGSNGARLQNLGGLTDWLDANRNNARLKQGLAGEDSFYHQFPQLAHRLDYRHRG